MSEHDHLEAVLPGFSKAREIIKAAGDSILPLEYKGTKFDFYRFCNRYRMAVRFKGISLDGFGDDTEAGYSALTHVFLTWSVFERYSYLVGDPPPYRQLFSRIPKMELAILADHIVRHDPEHRLYDFLHEQSLDQNREQLEKYRAGERKAVVFFAAAIRHIYVHGHLTASPNKCEAGNVTSICGALTTFILEMIRKDFQRRLAIANNKPSQG